MAALRSGGTENGVRPPLSGDATPLKGATHRPPACVPSQRIQTHKAYRDLILKGRKKHAHRFGRRVGQRSVPQRHAALDRGDVQDHASSARDHAGQEAAVQPDRGQQVHVEFLGPVTAPAVSAVFVFFDAAALGALTTLVGRDGLARATGRMMSASTLSALTAVTLDALGYAAAALLLTRLPLAVADRTAADDRPPARRALVGPAPRAGVTVPGGPPPATALAGQRARETAKGWKPCRRRMWGTIRIMASVARAVVMSPRSSIRSGFQPRSPSRPVTVLFAFSSSPER